MAEFREERVTTERADDPVVVDRGVAADPVRRGNPAPVIAAICIGLLILFLVLFGMSRNDGDGGNDDGVRVTVPNELDRNDGNDGGGSSDTKPHADADADAGTGTGGTHKP